MLPQPFNATRSKQNKKKKELQSFFISVLQSEEEVEKPNTAVTPRNIIQLERWKLKIIPAEGRGDPLCKRRFWKNKPNISPLKLNQLFSVCSLHKQSLKDSHHYWARCCLRHRLLRWAGSDLAEEQAVRVWWSLVFEDILRFIRKIFKIPLTLSVGNGSLKFPPCLGSNTSNQ